MPILTPATTTARKAQVAGGAGFFAPLFVMIPCSPTATACTDSTAAGLLLIQAGFAAMGMGEAPDPAMLQSALNILVMAAVTSAVAFVGTYFTTNKPKE
jgi:hypothetical protein